MKRYIFVLAFAVVAVCTTAKTATAQEILLEGPLAGAPAVRKLVQYREMRFSVGPQFGYTLLNEYMHNFMLGAKLEFNIFEWLSVGLVGYYVVNAPTKLTQHISESEDIAGDATTPADSNFPSYTGADNFEEQVSLMKGMYLAQIGIIPLRGKLAVFEKMFVAIDGYIFLGGGIVNYEERELCNRDGDSCGSMNMDGSGSITRESRITGTFTFGVGFTTYFNEWIGLSLEYRLAPFKWNSGGTDEAGQAGTEWELVEDEDDNVVWEPIKKGSGDYPDGNIDEHDRKWNSNQSIALGIIFHFPLEPTVAH